MEINEENKVTVLRTSYRPSLSLLFKHVAIIFTMNPDLFISEMSGL